MQSQHLKKLAIGSFIVLGFTSLATPIGYLSRLVLARAVSVEDFGLFYAVIALFWFFITFNDLGFGYSILYFVPKWVKEKQYSNIWNAFIYEIVLEIGTCLVIGSILFFSAHRLATGYFNTDNATLIIKILLLYFLGNSLLSALKRIFTGLQQEYYYASVEFFRLLLITIVSALVMWQGESRLWVYAVIWSGSHLVLAAVYSLLFYFKNNQLVRRVTWNQKLFNTMLQYAVPTLIVQSVAVFTNYADTIMLTFFRGTTAVGIYNVYYPIASIPLFLLTPLSTLLLPFYSYHIQDGSKKLTAISYFFLKLLLFAGLYFGLFISFYSNQSISLLFGEKWSSFGSLGLKILSIGFIFQLLTIYYIAVVNGLGMVKTRLRISAITSVLVVLLGSLATYMYGLIGLICVNIFVYFVSSLLFGKVAHQKLSLNFPIKFSLIVAAVLFIIAVTTKFIFPDPVSLAQFLITGILYSICVFIFGYLVFKSELGAIIFELKQIQNRKLQ